MIGDISRLPTFGTGYRQVVLQQGRVLLDADFNEQGALAAHALRQLTRDLVGAHAGPSDDLGFAIAIANGAFTISRGRYYVGGLLAANASPPLAAPAGPLAFAEQEVFTGSAPPEPFTPTTAYFFYLDVWERAVSWLEDDTIREVALGGPDTAVRRQLVWQVRAIERPKPETEFNDTATASTWLAENVQRHTVWDPVPGPRLPLMRAFVDPTDNPDDTPCVADPLGGYRGLENQLYRVQIHAAPDGVDQAASGALTFTWSRENGSVMAAWTGQVDSTLIVAGVRDTEHGFAAGQWVEISDRLAELRGESGVLVRLVKVERDHLTYDPATASGGLPSRDKLVAPIVRRWDHGTHSDQALLGGAIVIEEDRDYELERGIRIRFPKQSDAVKEPRRYAVGDWWGFAARFATADIEWPYTLADVGGGRLEKTYLDRPPDGVEHVYAPLAIGTLEGATAGVKSLQRMINELSTPVP
jgi:hypothetical protein